MKCPYCKGAGELPDADLEINLDASVAVSGRKMVRLWPVEASFLYALRETYPAPCPYERIATAMYGPLAPLDVKGRVRVIKNFAAKKIVPLNYTISAYHKLGYALVRVK